jgi:hypothetical protein
MQTFKDLKLQATLLFLSLFPRTNFRTDERGTISVGGMVETVILIIVLVLVVAALFSNLNSSLTSYSTNETTFGPVLLILVPILRSRRTSLETGTWGRDLAQHRALAPLQGGSLNAP